MTVEAVVTADRRSQLLALRETWPHVHTLIDEERAFGFEADEDRDDFGTAQQGGRGESYVAAQQARPEARITGIRGLMNLVVGPAAGDRPVVLDLLGGDGLLHRVCLGLDMPDTTIVTCDASSFMVASAWATGVPAVRQRAQQQVFRSGSVDGVLLAYGSHHVPEPERQAVADEAWRVLRPGGRFVLHDFAEGSPMAIWFQDVVDKQSATGHRYAHFTADWMRECLARSGFRGVTTDWMFDPIVVTGTSEQGAQAALGQYLLQMYGLDKLVRAHGEQGAATAAFELALEIFRWDTSTAFDGMGGAVRECVVERLGPSTWQCVLPRFALVAVGEKPEP
ncbi:methyltransferase domain-containing protein [Streptomyces sp. 11x1]|uniref:methyltransferase domain-containing protein n=1 Tax=Streptomyces sp. 11x1 TaxID=3038642 RepID=UPI00292FA0F9|nr:methyltransferase domain-containing protein [Streptomyces sp. 11x1]WNZ11686.1 methyltransferase domain-containing protein [Streptomyces sp. 11x1]